LCWSSNRTQSLPINTFIFTRWLTLQVIAALFLFLHSSRTLRWPLFVWLIDNHEFVGVNSGLPFDSDRTDPPSCPLFYSPSPQTVCPFLSWKKKHVYSFRLPFWSKIVFLHSSFSLSVVNLHHFCWCFDFYGPIHSVRLSLVLVNWHIILMRMYQCSVFDTRSNTHYWALIGIFRPWWFDSCSRCTQLDAIPRADEDWEIRRTNVHQHMFARLSIGHADGQTLFQISFELVFFLDKHVENREPEKSVTTAIASFPIDKNTHQSACMARKSNRKGWFSNELLAYSPYGNILLVRVFLLEEYQVIREEKLIATTVIIDNRHEEQIITGAYRDSIAVTCFAHE
jgi:hypothetical protein